ncbi:MAG: 5-formyltetrahydrofolate cyclo-ligase [Treponema sp.]|nr:5-formyltetrahydrofolate cyclo-ligase [Treponema sp.]
MPLPLIQIQEQKATLRKTIRSELKQISRDELAAKSMKICGALESFPLYQQSKMIAFFMPLSTEPDILPLIKTAVSEGRQCFIPKVNDDGSMDFYALENNRNFDSQVKEGAFGILEPEDFLQKLDTRNKDYEKQLLMLVPCLAFDKTMNRLGKGKGFYDKFFQRLNVENTIGVCFDFQLLEENEIPCEKFDRKVKFVITDETIR